MYEECHSIPLWTKCTCESAERSTVERLVALVHRCAEERGYWHRLVHVQRCSLRDSEGRLLEPDRRDKGYCRIVEAAAAMGPPADYERAMRAYRAEQAYRRDAQHGVDLLGIQVRFKREARPGSGLYGRLSASFIFDLHADGRLVDWTPDSKRDYQAADREIRCELWMSARYECRFACDQGLYVMPRFLGLCRARYLPNLDSDCPVFRHYCALCHDDETARRRIRELDEDEFYDQYVKPLPFLG
jgi:hypothetical protein